ncbi:MAG: sugar transporter [Paracoccus sp. (in: a-proteobacteria)]|nr:sugar transporter [Paracoccus sp. (in: a-proteobacteria)]
MNEPRSAATPPAEAKPTVKADPATAAASPAAEPSPIDQTKPKSKGRSKAKQAAEAAAREIARTPVAPPAQPARMKQRHYGMAISFCIVVILPLIVAAWYLYTRAADQYASYVGFSVRSEGAVSPTDVMGGLGTLVGASSTSDADILFKFIQSRDLVERVNNRLDLREIWSKAPNDPVFRFRGGNTLEDLAREWDRKVRIHFDTGMIDLRILAFDPDDAQAIAVAILEEGGILVNQLNDIAREDALRYARQELERAEERLRAARAELSAFRNEYQMVDPAADVQGQVGVVASLQQQLAEQLVSLGLLRANAQQNDPRIAQTQLRIDVIREQIDAERQKFGSADGSVALSDLVGRFESLTVDRQFAETSYTAALAAYENARAEAMRQSRYLAPYIRPTLAQDAEFPERETLMAMIAGFLILFWIIGTLVFYSLRDRR